MKIKLLIIIGLFSVYINSNSQINQLSINLDEIMYSELEYVKSAYEECLLNSCYGDSFYFKNWLDGLISEKNQNYSESLEYYQLAYNYKRYELYTYDIEFSIGRIQLKYGNIDLGKKYLREFITNAKNDLNCEEQMWGFTEESRKILINKIKQATLLINKFDLGKQ